jgi:hypothetical protein
MEGSFPIGYMSVQLLSCLFPDKVYSFLFRKVGCGSWSWRRGEFPRESSVFWEYEAVKSWQVRKPGLHSLILDEGLG